MRRGFRADSYDSPCMNCGRMAPAIGFCSTNCRTIYWQRREKEDAERAAQDRQTPVEGQR